MKLDKINKIESLEKSPLSASDNEHDEMSRILWIDDRSYTKMPLITQLRSHHGVYTFLKVFATVWPEESCQDLGTVGLCVWNLFARFVIITSAVLIIANFVSFISGTTSFVGFDLSSWGLDLIFTVQTIALMCSLFAIRRRLSSISTSIEVSYFERSLKYCVIYFASSFFPSILYPIYHVLLLTTTKDADGTPIQLAVYCILPFSEIAIAGFLSVHMLFILVDAQTLAENFTYLNDSLLASSGRTNERSKMILREIQRRVTSSLVEVLPIIVTALLEIIVLSDMVHKDYLKRDFVPMLLLIFLFLKEIQFLCVVLVMMMYCGVRRWMLLGKKKA